jgi:hypothetical protein
VELLLWEVGMLFLEEWACYSWGRCGALGGADERLFLEGVVRGQGANWPQRRTIIDPPPTRKFTGRLPTPTYPTTHHPTNLPVGRTPSSFLLRR